MNQQSFQSKEIHSSKFDQFLKNYKGEINIIFNSFFPLHLMNDFDSKLFLTQSQLTPLLFVSSLKKNLKINKKLKINKIILSVVLLYIQFKIILKKVKVLRLHKTI